MIKITNYSRYEGKTAGPFVVDTDIEVADRPAVDVLEDLFTTGYLSVCDRVEIRGTTYRVDPEDFSLVIDPEVAYTYVTAEGVGVTRDFYAAGV